MKKALLIIVLLVTSISLMFGTDNDDARKMFETSRQKLVLKNIHLVLNLKTTNNKGISKNKELAVSYGDFIHEQKVLVEFLAPENVKGTKILATDYPEKRGIIEIFMPATGRIQKIRANQRNMKIMDSEIPIEQFRSIINADLCYSFLDKGEFNGQICHKIKVQSKNEDGYEVVYVSVDKELIVHMENFDKKERLIRTTDISNYKAIPNNKHKMYPQVISVQNLKSGKNSKIQVQKIKYILNINSKDFMLL